MTEAVKIEKVAIAMYEEANVMDMAMGGDGYDGGSSAHFAGFGKNSGGIRGNNDGYSAGTSGFFNPKTRPITARPVSG